LNAKDAKDLKYKRQTKKKERKKERKTKANFRFGLVLRLCDSSAFSAFKVF
jgi:hypothetical protein